jgi:hypothetical protein
MFTGVTAMDKTLAVVQKRNEKELWLEKELEKLKQDYNVLQIRRNFVEGEIKERTIRIKQYNKEMIDITKLIEHLKKFDRNRL